MKPAAAPARVEARFSWLVIAAITAPATMMSTIMTSDHSIEVLRPPHYGKPNTEKNQRVSHIFPPVKVTR